MNRVSPSILSADFVNLERDIRALTPAGADYVHVDVMDGLFVPNISIGLPVVSAIPKGHGASAGRASDDRPAHPLCRALLSGRCRHSHRPHRGRHAGKHAGGSPQDPRMRRPPRDLRQAQDAAGGRSALSAALQSDPGHDRRAGLRRTVLHGGHDAEGRGHPPCTSTSRIPPASWR